eukprot:3378271-Amphidinium_carterae.1
MRSLSATSFGLLASATICSTSSAVFVLSISRAVSALIVASLPACQQRYDNPNPEHYLCGTRLVPQLTNCIFVST